MNYQNFFMRNKDKCEICKGLIKKNKCSINILMHDSTRKYKSGKNMIYSQTIKGHYKCIKNKFNYLIKNHLNRF